jgi:hypothetical protein
MTFYQNRRFPRWDFKVFPWVFALRLDKPFEEERPLRVEAKNISQGGLKFFSNHKISLFSLVEVSVFEKCSGKELAQATGKVIRLEEIDTGRGEKTFGIALEFQDANLLEPLLKVPQNEPK